MPKDIAYNLDSINSIIYPNLIKSNPFSLTIFCFQKKNISTTHKSQRMSFWPFGQNFNHLSNNINKILDEYFSVLHTIELKENKQQQDINNGITISKSNLSSIAENANNSASSSLLYSDIDNDNINSVLTSKFIDEILEENELINELNKKNSTLLDFVCFGYFFDDDNSKVTNIEYLVNLLIHCCDVIDKHSLNIKEESVILSVDDIIG